MRNLLVELAPHDQGEDLAFPEREAGNGSVHGPEPKLSFMGLVASSEGTLNCFDQVLSGHRLQQEILCAVFDRSDTGLDIPVAREKDNGQRMSCFEKAGLELGTTQARHPHIEQDAAERVAWRVVQELTGRFVEDHFIAGDPQ